MEGRKSASTVGSGADARSVCGGAFASTTGKEAGASSAKQTRTSPCRLILRSSRFDPHAGFCSGTRAFWPPGRFSCVYTVSTRLCEGGASPLSRVPGMRQQDYSFGCCPQVSARPASHQKKLATRMPRQSCWGEGGGMQAPFCVTTWSFNTAHIQLIKMRRGSWRPPRTALPLGAAAADARLRSDRNELGVTGLCTETYSAREGGRKLHFSTLLLPGKRFISCDQC